MCDSLGSSGLIEGVAAAAGSTGKLGELDAVRGLFLRLAVP